MTGKKKTGPCILQDPAPFLPLPLIPEGRDRGVGAEVILADGVELNARIIVRWGSGGIGFVRFDSDGFGTDEFTGLCIISEEDAAGFG